MSVEVPPRRVGPAEPVRHGRLGKRGPWGTILKFLVAIVAVVSVGSVSIVAFAAWDVVSKVKPGIHLEPLPGHSARPVDNINAIEGGVNLVLTGTDTRTGQGGAFKGDLRSSSGVGNNDLTMLLHIAEDHKSATVVTFPRDLIVPIPSCPTSDGREYPASNAAMINTTLSRGGLSCTVRTVSSLTGLQIPFAAKITMAGVTAMSNAVGGVKVCLASPVIDRFTNPPLNLAAGLRTLKGAEALSFLRSRHGVGDGGDLGRISNQQVFLSALVRTVKSDGVLGNPLALYPLANAAVSNMEFSDTLTNPRTLVQIALALKNIDLSNVVFVQYPTLEYPLDRNRVIPNPVAAEALGAALRADVPVKLSGKTGVGASLPPTPSASPSPSPSASSSPGSPSPSPSTASPSPTPVTLPSAVTGQTAAQETCTKGNR
ncbi:MAG TPA: LCP family protein [Microbacteriaceae bacterium]